ncbi:cytochrome c oxidase subunit 3 [Myxococcota bacterium]|nr:cytochrome c oxidase subunit 3 [Myxococcota bacterium]
MGTPGGVPVQRNARILSNGALAMLIFSFAEVMLFAGLVSAFTIAKANALVWPPPGQPRLPAFETAFNTLALLLSGFFLYRAQLEYWRSKEATSAPVVVLQRPAAAARTPFLISILLGAFFVLFQGTEWVALLREGLTIASSQQGGFFYLIIGMHAAHAIAALALLVYAYRQLTHGNLTESLFGASTVFWYFVVLVWPVLYWRVYL